MNRRIGVVNLADFYQALRSLDYYSVKVQERRSEWRRGAFHLYAYPRAKSGLKLALHKDVWKTGPPAFSHEAQSKGKEIERELDTIEKRYREIRRKPSLSFVFQTIFSVGTQQTTISPLFNNKTSPKNKRLLLFQRQTSVARAVNMRTLIF